MAEQELFWFAIGPGDIRPARVEKGDPKDRGTLDLSVLSNAASFTYNEPFENLETGSRSFGPPHIVVTGGFPDFFDEEGEEIRDTPIQEEFHKSVAYDPNGADGTWHEP